MTTSHATELSGEPLRHPLPASASPESAARPWIARALSILAPGVGHLYAGLPKRGASAWLMTRVVGLLASATVLLVPGLPGLAGYAAVWIAVLVAVAIDAVRVVRAQQVETGTRARWYQGPLTLVVACGVVWAASIGWSMVVTVAIVEHTRILNPAMAPTILRGDRVWIARRRRASVRRGELVAYRRWDTPFVKRVVGVPGDTLAMRAGTLSIDGHAMVEPYAQHTDEEEISDRRFDWQRAFVPASDRATYAPTLATWGPLVVPAASYFLLGDNRGETSDSRYNGFVADSSIFGRPLTVYFSRDPVAGHIRWGRIGTRLTGTPLTVPSGGQRR